VRVAWQQATSIGLQYAGSLADGTQLPVEGPDWVTWNPATDSSPNLPGRLYGHERTIRALLSVVAGYRQAHPDAPRVVVGDISSRHGGRMDQHVSHQNGLDVDVYYPRRDRHLTAPATTSQVDRDLAQDLLDRFLAAGAKIVFVGYATDLRGPSGVVVPYPNHENHMHVRFPVPDN
jgi:murein endopeptidase